MRPSKQFDRVLHKHRKDPFQLGMTLSAMCCRNEESSAGDLKECAACGRSYIGRYFQVSKQAADGRFAQCRGCVAKDKQRRKRATVKAKSMKGHPPTQEPMCCSRCNAQLPANFFSVDSSKALGRLPFCLACLSDRSSKRPVASAADVPSQKVCSGPLCNGKVLPADSFTSCKINPDGLQHYCRQCQSHGERQRQQHLKTVPYGGVPAHILSAAHLRCSGCGETKPATEFHTDRNRRSGRQSDCKACQQSKDAKRYTAKGVEQGG